MKFENSYPGNNENPFALSFEVNFMTIHAQMKKFYDFKIHSYAIRAEIFLSPQVH